MLFLLLLLFFNVFIWKFLAIIIATVSSNIPTTVCSNPTIFYHFSHWPWLSLLHWCHQLNLYCCPVSATLISAKSCVLMPESSISSLHADLWISPKPRHIHRWPDYHHTVKIFISVQIFCQKRAMDPADWSSYRCCGTKKLGSIKHNSLVFHYFNFVSRKKKKKKKWIQISCFKKNTDLFPDERNRYRRHTKT